MEEELGDRTGDENFPLFPDRLGYELRPECVVFFIEAIATLIGEALFTGKGSGVSVSIHFVHPGLCTSP